ncbi:glutaryl-CoA dehydrogenase (non-decarboxylating) [Janthinobacterium sp. CG_23.3]|uniref:acyl-CoA dehydrogenase family protein n=1 Tax=Janthinobacterium sp. CG_23.3 TaxID=3349634 RepID=UPI0038D3B107
MPKLPEAMSMLAEKSAPARRQHLREVIAKAVGAQAGQFDLDQKIPAGLIAELAAEGMLGAHVPAEYGGAPVDARQFGELCEDIGYASASVLSLLTVHTMVSAAIAKWGSAAQKDRWLPRLASGATIGAFALSEPNVGSDAKNVETSMRREGDAFIVSGTKKWISFAQIAQLFLVIGNCEGRVTALLVARDTPGLTVEPIHDMLGFRAAMLGQLHLDECVIGKENLIGSLDFGYAQVVGSVLDQGRYCIAWGCVGLAQACLDACLDYTEQRQTFGQYLKEHQLVQRSMADMITNVQAARLLCEDAARLRAGGDPGMIMATATAKYFAARAVESAANDAVQIHGANGCGSEYPVQRYFRDAKIMNIIEGSAQMQQILIAQHGYRR